MIKLKNLLLLIIFAVITLTGCVNVYDESLKLDPVNSGEPDTPDTYLNSINNTLWITDHKVEHDDENNVDYYVREVLHFTTEYAADEGPYNIINKVFYYKKADGNTEFSLDTFSHSESYDWYIYEYDNILGEITLSPFPPDGFYNYWINYKGQLEKNSKTLNMIYYETPEQIEGGISFPDTAYTYYDKLVGMIK